MSARRFVLRSLVRMYGVVAAGRSDAGEHLLHRILTALALSVAVLLALSVGVAWAEPPKLIPEGNFSDQFPMGVAIDQSSGNVYVAGFFISNINKFDESGMLLKPPSPFGEGSFSGAAVNPINGDVYVDANLEREEKEERIHETRIETYDPSSGALLSSFPVPVSGNFLGATSVQIATDSAGNVYVPVVPENEVLEYSPAGTLLQTFTGSGAGALKEPTGVAVDSSGNVWVADDANNRIEELSSTGTFIGEIKSEGVRAIALDTHGDVFATVDNNADFCGSVTPPCFHLVEYSSAGTQIADVGAGEFEAFGGIGVMPAVNDASGRVYVTSLSFEHSLVWIFGPPTAPVVGKELVAEVGTSEAKLGALINPGGIEATYRFEYGTTTAYGQTTPFPEGDVGQGLTSRTVWATASGLAPGTTYHYRVVATNELAKTGVHGPDQTFTTLTAAQASCPNEQFRGGFSASLPDCRAYELVTPPNKTSSQPGYAESSEYLAARDGNRMAYPAIDSLPGSQSDGLSYLSTRGSGGWSTENVTPLQSYTGFLCPFFQAGMLAYSTADLSKGVLQLGREEAGSSEEGNGCGGEVREVVSGEPQGVINLLLRDNTDGAYQLINAPPPGVTPANARFQGASSDSGHVVFDEKAPLTPGAPAGGADDLYEWSGGVLRLVTYLPEGTPVVGSLAAQWKRHPGVISADGSHIFFTAAGKLYVRLNGSSTVQIDASQAGGSGGGSFWDASTAPGADGSQVFFTDDSSAGLTSDTVPGSGTNLYHYDLGSGQLTDLTPQSGAEVLEVSGISEDGSYAYFVANGVLASNENANKETATEGQPNLYLSHGGTTTFIATLANADTPSLGHQRVSANGIFLAFPSVKSLTGYDNTDANEESLQEIFLYSAGSNQLACASCNPSGEAPTGGATMETVDVERAGVPPPGVPHNLSDSGRLFFDTSEALLPSDTNGQTDVYEYEGDQLHLISSGTSSIESTMLDMSEGGSDAFFFTRQKLLPQDSSEEALNIYDARVDGGFPAPSTPPPCTTTDACRAAVAPQPSIFGAPSSATFSGAGNVPPASKPLTRAQKLAKALRACHKKKNKRKRAACERQAKKRYGARRLGLKRPGKVNASRRGGK